MKRNKLTIFIENSGEKMSFQITVLLTTVVYVDMLQQTIPPFKNVETQPKLITFFSILLTGLFISLVGIF